MVRRKMIKNLPWFVMKTVFWIITFLLSWCMRIQNSITPAASQNHIWQPITYKFYSLNCWYYSVLYKKSCSQLMIFVSFSLKKIEFPALTVRPLPHLTFCSPTKSNLYLANSLDTVVSDPDLYRLLTYQVSNLMSLFHCLGHTKGSVQACGNCVRFITRTVFTVRNS